jgi:hypothetical protein
MLWHRVASHPTLDILGMPLVPGSTANRRVHCRIGFRDGWLRPNAAQDSMGRLFRQTVFLPDTRYKHEDRNLLRARIGSNEGTSLGERHVWTGIPAG